MQRQTIKREKQQRVKPIQREPEEEEVATKAQRSPGQDTAANSMLGLQQQVGNQAVQRLLAQRAEEEELQTQEEEEDVQMQEEEEEALQTQEEEEDIQMQEEEEEEL